MSANHKIVLDYMLGYAEERNIKFSVMALDLENRIDKSSLREILSEERLAGRVVTGLGGYRLSGTARKELGEIKTATAPYRNVFGPELSPQNYLRKGSIRPGDEESKSWRSRHV